MTEGRNLPNGLMAFLANSPIFDSLNEADRGVAARLAIARSYRSNEIVAHYGEVWPYLFIVADGEVEAVKESSEGRSFHIATIAAEDVFWGLAFFDENAPMPVMLSAREDSLLYLWSRESMFPVLARNGGASLELCRFMIVRMQRASQIVEELAFQPVGGRVARMLLDQFPPGQGAVPRNLTLDEMAARIGSTREMVCRFLHRFADEGLIKITRTEFLVTSPDELERLARQVKG